MAPPAAPGPAPGRLPSTRKRCDTSVRTREVLLGLIDLKPDVTGYELRSELAEMPGVFYSASLGHIYPTLKRLVDDGLADVTSEPFRGEMRRKRYALTEAGRSALQRWLREPFVPQDRATAFHDFQVKLAFVGGLDDQELLAYLRSGRDFFAGELGTVEAAADKALESYRAGFHGAPHERYTLLWTADRDELTAQLRREVSWIDELIDALRLGE